MKKDKATLDHLIRNLERISPEKSIFNYKSGKKAFLSLGQGNFREWLETLLPNTRIILEPKIIGISIAIQYIDGKIKKAINKNSEDITEKIISIKSIPKALPIKNIIEIRGILFDEDDTSYKSDEPEFLVFQKRRKELNGMRFCAFQIFNCKINQFQALKELKNLNFEIPQTQFTNFISDIDIYLQCWKEGKLFNRYPTNGIVLKINSRKLQKCLGENNLSIHWGYAIN